MAKKITLDQYEQDIEDNIEHQIPLKNLSKEVAMLRRAAKSHARRKKSITLRVHEPDLEAMRVKASKAGVPYQTYINMLIHRDATTL